MMLLDISDPLVGVLYSCRQLVEAALCVFVIMTSFTFYYQQLRVPGGVLILGVFLCGPLRSLRLRLFQRRGRGGTQRTAEKKLKVRHYWVPRNLFTIFDLPFTIARHVGE